MSEYRTEFFARYHEATGSADGLDSAHYERCARQFRGRWERRLPADKSLAMVDLGCGCGEYLYFLRLMGYHNVLGIDVCESELEQGRRMGIPNLVRAGALEFLADKSETFGVISAFNLFEHLEKDAILSLLNRIHQALRPGGKLLAVTPNGVSPFGGSTRYWDFSHETGFTPAAWRQLARMTGFSSIQFEEYGPIPHSLAGIVRVVLWKAIRLGLDAVSYIEVGRPRDVARVYTADMKIILEK